MTISKHLIAATIFFVITISSSISMANAEETKEELLDELVTAILSNDYEQFIANGTDEFKSGITKDQFDNVSNQFNDLSLDGYSSEYLTDLNQSGLEVHLWKLTHTESDDDMLARLVTSDSKVAGFWIQ